jgi:NADH-quinone oxidoreductase subunit B
VPADKFMPVDVHVPGCPPRPEALLHGILKLRKMIQEDPDMGWRAGHQAYGTEEVVPGEDQATAVNVFRQSPGGGHGA